MICLKKNEGENFTCRESAKDYLECRMENNLMTKEEWSKLGYADLDASKATNQEKEN